MTRPGSTNDHGTDRLQGKGQDPGQVLPSEDWALVLTPPPPKKKLTSTNHVTSMHATPENFIQNGLSIQKIFNIFHSLDRWTQKQITIQSSAKFYNEHIFC